MSSSNITSSTRRLHQWSGELAPESILLLGVLKDFVVGAGLACRAGSRRPLGLRRPVLVLHTFDNLQPESRRAIPIALGRAAARAGADATSLR
eukprot:CAMPEP_0180538542 /NCGR_PEP_ID=MMETSP1036_2-20121128/66405_1 /TAXON_ID=632150 /ORGANISM="Azadinium spinosum, Strain 3D9" /LENGTH=92 /DNA_ID=CAMNT_0022553211 /DNA_START=144 /DNA_END=422 /DNA_ORIENTATION=-